MTEPQTSYVVDHTAVYHGMVVFAACLSTGLMIISVVTACKVRKFNQEVNLKSVMSKLVERIRKERRVLEKDNVA
ncbi:unnamed protein product [Bursaphelenchus okinawaensis]|uniref:Uncharacterized protein n=1 Tax=Bursaphelenchus okinawaensis TaxID=465554 RepID=A0A811L8E9_9BILA|nr:unnamed protein product [Bursaphelenchus okinawaensis]CAG9118878.1 unnamed protein product [Bursaphelenchus okinawaensis]